MTARFLRKHEGIEVGQTYRSQLGTKYFVKAITSDGYIHCDRSDGQDRTIWCDVMIGWTRIDNASLS